MPDPQTRSDLERQALQMFMRANLPMPVCQYQVVEDDRLLGTVDFAWPSAKVIVEAESFEFHSGRKAWEKDTARYNSLAPYAWCMLRLTKADVRSGGDSFIQLLTATLKARWPQGVEFPR
jgi:very-short-patch-repair endonuclease